MSTPTVSANLHAPGRKKSRRLSDKALAMALIAPPLLFLLAFTLYPIARVFWMSLHQISVTQPWLGTPFIGLDNYAEALKDSRFWQSTWFTLAFSLITVVFEIVFGLLLAMVANKTFRFRGFVRAAILFPWALPAVTNALTWRWMFNADYGLFNGMLLQFGWIDQKIQWLGSTGFAFTAICIVAIWKTSSFMAIILLGGLQSISSDIYEASHIDGASRVQAFFLITLPLLKNVFLVALVLRTMHSLQAFDLMYALTQGGPGNSTESLPMYIHTKAFVDMEWGYGSALGVLLFVLIFAISMIYLKFLYDPD
ncbi:carbohydrate ABC transporter permease [Paenibacillus thalictri]|uniref:carbohydrate ABC transporter permease n=1 Tax=Paenibacillus thalictri TaxID=2527873 RepID=UPI0013EF2BC3|nr:sugar ABC transporter permease [Paenibacillus thalictri]